MSCVFDMPEEHMDAIQGVCEDEACLEVCNELPALKVSMGEVEGMQATLLVFFFEEISFV